MFTARTIYNRHIEKHNDQTPLPNEYSRILVLRISPDAAAMLKDVQCSNIMTYDIPFLKYWGHVVWRVARKKEVRQWRDVNFEIIGIKEAVNHVDFDDIFRVSAAEYDQVRELLKFQREEKACDDSYRVRLARKTLGQR